MSSYSKNRTAAGTGRLMTARVHNVYELLDDIKGSVSYTCDREGLSPLLFWLLIRQQADYELLKLQLDD